MSRKLFSLENIDNTVLDGSGNGAFAESLRAETEITTEADDIIEDVGAVDEAVEAADRLEDVAAPIERSVEEGTGIDPAAAELAQVAVESIMSNIGARGYGVKVIPSIENFGSANTKLHSARVSLEGIGQTIKAVWEKVKETLKAIWQKISDFFVKFFDNTEKVNNAIKACREKVNGLTGKKAKEKTIDSKALAGGFSIKGKFTSKNIDDIVNNHIAMTVVSNRFVDLCKNGVTLVEQLAKDKIDAAVKTMDKLSDTGVELVEGIKLSSTPTTKSKTKKDGNEVTTVEHGPYFQGRRIVLTAITNPKNGLVSLGMEIKESSEAADKGSVDVLTPEEMNKALDIIEALNKETTGFKKNQEFFKTLQAESNKIIASAFKIAETIVDQSEENTLIKRNLAAAKAGLTSFSSVASRYTTMTPSWNVNICNRVITGVNECIAVYK